MRRAQVHGRRPGFTLVEVLTVIVLLGALVVIAVPHYTDATRAADAAAVVSDFHTVHVAGMMHLADRETFPPTAPEGEVPPELVSYLPDGFSFTYKGGVVTYRWRLWGSSDGTMSNVEHAMVAGLEVHSEDEKLMAAIQHGFRGAQTIQDKKKTTFVIH